MIKTISFILIISSLIISCSNKSNDLYINQPKQSIEDGSATDTAKAVVHEPNRDVDILFIIDQSASMATIIKEVHENIDRFADEFTADDKNKVNFRIGVTTAWDTNHFAKLEQQWINNKSEYIANGDVWPNLNFKMQKGKLKSLKINGKVDATVAPFVTPKTKDLYETLRNTLKVDAEIYKYEITKDREQLRNVYQLTQRSPFLKNSKKESLYGASPENEEFFTVIRKMISPELESKKLRIRTNQEFPNPKANQLAVFIITDADDDTKNLRNISPKKIHEELVSFMGNDPSKVVVYGALFESGRTNCKVRKLDQNGQFELEPQYINGHPGIDGENNPKFVSGQDTYKLTDKKRDPGKNGSYNAPVKIEELVKLSGGQVKSICSKDFGAELASVGFNIREKTLEQKNVTIDLKTAYDPDTLTVYYGSKEIPYNRDFGWSIQPYRYSNTVIVINKDAYVYEDNKKFKIEFKKITEKNLLKDEDY